MSSDHARRRAAVRVALRARGLSALLVTDLVNIRYLTGFTGSNAALLVEAAGPRAGESGSAAGAASEGGASEGGAEAAVLATDGRYTEQAAQQVPDLRVIIERDCAYAVLAHGCAPDPVRTDGVAGPVGFEADRMTVAEHGSLVERLNGWDEAPRLEPTTRIVEGAREIKDAGEADLIAQACAIGDHALADLFAQGAPAPGMTERQVARRLEWLMYERGAEAIAFETIVAAGANSAIPHHRPTDAVLETGDLVKLDFGATVGGYNSDMTRTVVLGAPSEFQRDLYALVLEAQQAGVAAVRAGAAAADVDHAARSVIEQAGLGKQFSHGLGHGVGLRVHEAPGVSAGATGTLSEGAVVTVEPGVYHVGRGGVRIEDTLLVRSDGAEVLTKTGKDLRVL